MEILILQSSILLEDRRERKTYYYSLPFESEMHNLFLINGGSNINIRRIQLKLAVREAEKLKLKLAFSVEAIRCAQSLPISIRILRY